MSTERRVANKYLYRKKLGITFYTQQALRDYMKEHPKADPSKHEVKEKGEGKGDSKGEGISKEKEIEKLQTTAKSTAKKKLTEALGDKEKLKKTLEDFDKMAGGNAPDNLMAATSYEFKRLSPATRSMVLSDVSSAAHSLNRAKSEWDKDFASDSGEWDEKKEKKAVKLLQSIQSKSDKLNSKLGEVFDGVKITPDLKGTERAEKALEEHKKKPWYKKLLAHKG